MAPHSFALFALMIMQLLLSGFVLFSLSSFQAATRAQRELVATPNNILASFTAIVDPLATEFVRFAEGTATDKVTVHGYQYAYHRYLSTIRLQRLQILEIGLGCYMPLGPGGSVVLWSKYLPMSDLTILEYDERCGTTWESSFVPQVGSRRPKLIYGDQRNRTLLQDIVAKYGPFDVIIDDGGHTMDMQLLSFQTLFPALREGGLYFIEDLHTSFLAEYGGEANGVKGTSIGYVLDRIRDLIGDTFKGWSDKQEVDNLLHIDCYKHLCILQKMR